jgi:hypothetical protein
MYYEFLFSLNTFFRFRALSFYGGVSKIISNVLGIVLKTEL